MQDFRKLEVWAKSHELTVQLYRATDHRGDAAFPILISQLQSTASSIPSSIAAGCGLVSQTELGRFLQRAITSSQQLQYLLMLAHDLGLIPVTSLARLDARASQVRQMLVGLLKRVRAQRRPPSRRNTALSADSR